MEILDFFTAPTIERSIVSIGMFDGVHEGHKVLLQQLKNMAREKSATSVIVTFPEHPLYTLMGEAPLSIVSWEKKLFLLDNMGIDVCLMLPFNHQVAHITAESFLEKYLLNKFGMCGMVMGKNFRFGANGQGDVNFLQQNSEKFQYDLKILSLEEIPMRVSSTQIRIAVSGGDMNKAQKMLGRPFSLIGTVIHGKKRGRLLGFPTANMKLHHQLTPPQGVYWGQAKINNINYIAVISIGKCATFNDVEDIKIEIHYIGFSGDLYDSVLETEVWGTLREQKKFASKEELCQQIQADIETAKQKFATCCCRIAI
ncbi:MAG: riboflavin biosynthesis protein RibF [Planctomycetes bacterium]|nr:riboflavin biosynthesis protein RibF [Planctomycetota bacterium]